MILIMLVHSNHYWVQVEELRKKLNGPDYKEKLGVLVSDLYKLAFNTYKDIPRGPIKVKQQLENEIEKSIRYLSKH